jgi:hypothetical protein
MHSSPIDILPLNPRVIYEGFPNIDIAENRTATSSISLGTFLLRCLRHLISMEYSAEFIVVKTIACYLQNCVSRPCSFDDAKYNRKNCILSLCRTCLFSYL